MVRFKVVKGSQLLMAAAVVVLALVVGGIVLATVLSDSDPAVGAQASLVRQEEEAKTETVFASSLSVLPLDPSDAPLRIEVVPECTPAAETRSVLIYHTHTHEAYEQAADDQYVAIEAWRTMDEDHSVVRVGEELARLLRERGFEVVHDTTDHEQTDLKTAYTRSMETLQSYDRRFDLYIDLHRDAYLDGMETAVVDSNGARLAPLMMLIGNGVGFTDKPYYEENLAFAQALTERINALRPNLCKKVLVKDGRYNQSIGVFSILIEVGHNRNTLREALASLPDLADGLQSLMISDPDAKLEAMRGAGS